MKSKSGKTSRFYSSVQNIIDLIKYSKNYRKTLDKTALFLVSFSGVCEEVQANHAMKREIAA